MAQVPTGTTFFIASAFAAAQNTTVVTNAVEAVVTVAGHGYNDGDIVEISSGWGRLNKRVFRVKDKATDTFKLEGMNTSSTTFFPTGSGLGSVRKVTTFTQIQQVLAMNSQGGDPVNVEYKYMEADVRYSINDGFGATTQSLEVDADSNTTSGFTALQALTEAQTDTCLKTVSRSGSLEFAPCKVALNPIVRRQDGQVNRNVVTFNGNGRPTAYAA